MQSPDRLTYRPAADPWAPASIARESAALSANASGGRLAGSVGRAYPGTLGRATHASARPLSWYAPGDAPPAPARTLLTMQTEMFPCMHMPAPTPTLQELMSDNANVAAADNDAEFWTFMNQFLDPCAQSPASTGTSIPRPMSVPPYFPTAAPDMQLSMAPQSAPPVFMLHAATETPAPAPPSPYDLVPPAHTNTRTYSGPPHFDLGAPAHDFGADAYSDLQPRTAPPSPATGPAHTSRPALPRLLPRGPPGAGMPFRAADLRADGRARRQAPACLFCRDRKIACGRPPRGADAEGPATCDQCLRRGRTPGQCVYPKETRRGHHLRIKSQLKRAAASASP